MKRKIISLGNWGELLKEKDFPITPKGYSTVDDIAKKFNYSRSHIRELLKNAREKGKLSAIQGKTKTGQIAWFYKD